jgi:hypothetical protein
LDDDLFAALGEIDEARELALGFVHSYANHDHTVARA